MVGECERESKRACFLSTPSIFFSLNDKALQANSKVFDVSPDMGLRRLSAAMGGRRCSATQRRTREAGRG